MIGGENGELKPPMPCTRRVYFRKAARITYDMATIQQQLTNPSVRRCQKLTALFGGF